MATMEDKVKVLQIGQKVKFKKNALNLIGEIIEISPMQMFAVIKDEWGNHWPVPKQGLLILSN
jgi:hypothetical protein